MEIEPIKTNEWLTPASMNAVPPKRGPIIDRAVSNIVGKEIRTTDPRLIQLITKWKQTENKGDNDKINSNYLEDPKKIEELKKVFA